MINSPAYCLIALKIASYISVVIPLIMLIAKAFLRWKYQFYIIESSSPITAQLVEGKSQEGIFQESEIDVPTEAITWIKEHIHEIDVPTPESYPPLKQLEFREPVINNVIFKLQGYPIIFKTPYRGF